MVVGAVGERAELPRGPSEAAAVAATSMTADIPGPLSDAPASESAAPPCGQALGPNQVAYLHCLPPSMLLKATLENLHLHPLELPFW